jgi:DNA-binding transcriptional regulator YdaS (Cro superfamily)
LPPPIVILSRTELAMLAVFLFGARWQAALARLIAVDRRLVGRWAAGERRVSARCSMLIIAAARERHRARLAALEDRFAMIAAALSEPVRRALLADPRASAPVCGASRRPGRPGRGIAV